MEFPSPRLVQIQRAAPNLTRSNTMAAKYTSNKPDGYMSTRNNIYLERGRLQEIRTYKEAGACRNLPPQSKANYGKKSAYEWPKKLTSY